MAISRADLPIRRFYSWQVRVDPLLTERYLSRRKAHSTICKCEWCANWRAAVGSGLPTSLKFALRRLGVKPTREDDVYQQTTTDAGVLYRAEFTCVGEIVSGPDFWVLKDRAWYPYPWLIRDWPWYLGVGVTTRDGRNMRLNRWARYVPAFTVELRIVLPWVLPENMPSPYAT
jgi:hypothetical protein